jgi:hypothetical protein
MEKKKNRTKSKKNTIELVVAKYGLLSTILVSVLGLLGTGITAYFGYLGIQAQIESPLNATRTAESRVTAISEIPTQTFPAAFTAKQTVEPIVTIVPEMPMPTSIIAQSLQTLSVVDSYQDYIIVYPGCGCDEFLSPQDKILLRLRWAGTTAENAEKGANFIKYVVTFDGDDISNTIGSLDNYRKRAIMVADPIISGDPSNAWWVYWDIPFGELPSFEIIEVTLRLELLAAINTGWDVLPAGLIKTYVSRIHTTIPPPTPSRRPPTQSVPP